MWHWRLKVADKRLKKKPKLIFKLSFISSVYHSLFPKNKKNRMKLHFRLKMFSQCKMTRWIDIWIHFS